MRIIQFVHNLSSGGAETLVKDYGIGLMKAGHDVIVLTVSYNPDFPNYRILVEAGVKVRSIFGYDVTSKTNLILKAIRHFSRTSAVREGLREIIREFRPDVMHCHMSVVEYLQGLESELEGCGLFFTCHTEPREYFMENKGHDQIVRNLVRRLGMKNVALHPDMKKELDEMYGPGSCIVLNNPLSLSRFQYSDTGRTRIREELGIGKECFVLGHVGRFMPEKNHALIVRVFAELKRRRQDAFLLLVGSGELESEVRASLDDSGLSDSYAILHNRSDVPDILSAMDVFLFPSVIEGLGISFLEAQSVGLRCVVSGSINSYTYASNDISVLGLEEDLATWADVLLGDDSHKVEQTIDLKAFDLISVIRDLEYEYGKLAESVD